MQLRRADTSLSDDSELAHVTYNDKYVVVYNFADLGSYGQTKVAWLALIIQTLRLPSKNSEPYARISRALDSILRFGEDTTSRFSSSYRLLESCSATQSISLGAAYHCPDCGQRLLSSSVKDWLYGITKDHPGGTANSVVAANYEAEDVLSVYHLVNWRKELGGAGITPERGQWENVSSIFPLHDPSANRKLLTHLSSRMFLNVEDLDRIRDIWGAKVAFYFAFIQTYFRSLFFPCGAGIFAWAFLPKYSLFFALVIGVWCTCFLEYWKIKQTDLAIRWDVRGVGDLKVNRPEFHYEKEIVDAAGRVRQYFPRWKRVFRQLVVVPFVLVSTLLLGLLIAFVFVVETYISEAYDGSYKFYLVSPKIGQKDQERRLLI